MNKNGLEKIGNYIFKQLEEMGRVWGKSLSQVDIDNRKRQFIIACYENDINTQEKIKRGIAKARSEEGNFMPAAGTFVSWCKETKQHWEHAALEHQSQKTDKLLLEIKNREINKQVGKQAIEELKMRILK